MAHSYKLPCPACKKNATVAPGLLTTRFQRVRCPYCFYEWQANKFMLIIGDSPNRSPSQPGAQAPDVSASRFDKPNIDPTFDNKNPENVQAPTNVSPATSNQPKNVNTATTAPSTSDVDDSDLLAIDVSRMNDGDYQEYQANQERLKKFKRKVKGQGGYAADDKYRGQPRTIDWFTILGLLLGVAVAVFLLLVLLIIFHPTIVRHIPEAEDFYNWLSYILKKILKKFAG